MAFDCGIFLLPETSNEKTVFYRREEQEMAANCPPQMAALEDGDQSASVEGGGSPDISSVVLERLGQIVCAMHGHDNLIQFEQNRMFLKCASCGHETPGWTLPDRRPVARVSGAPREAMTTAVASIDAVKRVA